MDIIAQRMLVLGGVGVAIAILSIWLHINNKDGSGWAVLAVLLLLSSCGQH